MGEDDTHVGPLPQASDIVDDDDTDREIDAQGIREASAEMFDDTGVVIIDRPLEQPPAATATFAVTFRKPTRRPTPRAHTAPRVGTSAEWPPAPREPAERAPQIRERALKNASVYTVVARPVTQT